MHWQVLGGLAILLGFAAIVALLGSLRMRLRRRPSTHVDRNTAVEFLDRN